MKSIKKIFNSISKVPLNKRVQIALAFILTVALLVSAPSFAWFSYKRRIVKLQKVEAPNVLVLSAAHREESKCFEINGINAEETAVDVYLQPIRDQSGTDSQGDPILQNRKITYKDYAFCVTGDAVDKFTIQLAYTTNNPFTYEVYAAEELTESELYNELYTISEGEEPPYPKKYPDKTPIDYVAYTIQGKPVEIQETSLANYVGLSGANYHLTTNTSDVLYYRIDASINEGNSNLNNGRYTGAYLNSSDGTDANASGIDYERAYGSYTNTHSDAKPVYWQTTNVSAIPGSVNTEKAPFSRHFILRVKWTAGSLDNTAKETDIVYLAVKATS